MCEWQAVAVDGMELSSFGSDGDELMVLILLLMIDRVKVNKRLS